MYWSRYIPICQPCCIAGSDGVQEKLPLTGSLHVANSYIRFYYGLKPQSSGCTLFAMSSSENSSCLDTSSLIKWWQKPFAQNQSVHRTYQWAGATRWSAVRELVVSGTHKSQFMLPPSSSAQLIEAMWKVIHVLLTLTINLWPMITQSRRLFSRNVKYFRGSACHPELALLVFCSWEKLWLSKLKPLKLDASCNRIKTLYATAFGSTGNTDWC